MSIIAIFWNLRSTPTSLGQIYIEMYTTTSTTRLKRIFIHGPRKEMIELITWNNKPVNVTCTPSYNTKNFDVAKLHLYVSIKLLIPTIKHP